jgi:hypothetical protein
MRRISLLALSSVCFLAAGSAGATTVAPTATLSGMVGQIQLATVSFLIGDGSVLPQGTFRGSATFSAIDGSLVSCDGSVIPSGVLEACDGSVLPGDGSVKVVASGSVNPFLAFDVTFLDAGDPTALSILFGTPIAPIPGLASTALEGYLDIPGAPDGLGEVKTVLPSGKFLEGSVNGAPALALGDGPIAQTVAAQSILFGLLAGGFDCAAYAGGCTFISAAYGVTGLGGGQQLTFGGRFDVDAVTPVPLPAPALLLAAALGGLSLLRRRT